MLPYVAKVGESAMKIIPMLEENIIKLCKANGLNEEEVLKNTAEILP